MPLPLPHGSSQTIDTHLDPGLEVIKDSDNTYTHKLFDIVRGPE